MRRRLFQIVVALLMFVPIFIGSAGIVVVVSHCSGVSTQTVHLGVFDDVGADSCHDDCCSDNGSSNIDSPDRCCNNAATWLHLQENCISRHISEILPLQSGFIVDFGLFKSKFYDVFGDIISNSPLHLPSPQITSSLLCVFRI